MRKSFRFIALILLTLGITISASFHSIAAEWNGSSANGTVGGSIPSCGGYVIHNNWSVNVSGTNTVMALRFLFYNADTGVTKGIPVDIYKNAYEDYMGWTKLGLTAPICRY